MLAWYVAKVKPKGEQQVEAYLGRYGVEVYAPQIVAPHRGHGRLERLFPSYVFVRTDPASTQWPLVRWARGVSYFLGNTQAPVPCPEGLVETIGGRVRRWNEGGWKGALQEGDQVLVRSGPFRGLEAIFQRYVPGNDRCHVLIALMGRAVQVTVRLDEMGDIPLRRRFAGSG